MPWMEGKKAVAWIDEYVQKKGPNLLLLAEGVRRLVKRAVPQATESVNPWRIPTFQSNGPMCFFILWKDHLTFGFLRGSALNDPHKLLEGSGKNFLHVKVRALADLKKTGLKQLIRDAAKLNAKEPMQGMKVSKKK